MDSNSKGNETNRKEGKIQKSVNCATDIMSYWKIPMTERYVKWEKLIYKAAMKTIGRTTYKATGPKKTI